MAGQEAQGLLAVWTDIAPEAEAEFNEWYNTEHIPQLVGIPGIISGRRYQAVEGGCDSKCGDCVPDDDLL
jgi:hypothetical protein